MSFVSTVQEEYGMGDERIVHDVIEHNASFF